MKKPNAEYWRKKMEIYLHDPFTKALRIQQHEEHSSEILEAYGCLSIPPKEEFIQADIIASAMDRAQLPGFSKNEKENGAISFTDNPILTHPTGKGQKLKLKLPDAFDNWSAAKHEGLIQEIKAFLKSEESLGSTPGGKGLSSSANAKGNEQEYTFLSFLYSHLQLRGQLAKKDFGGLGSLWYRLPADTRVPDHPIWNHCALVSSLSSAIQQSSTGRASLLVYSLSPVQNFIGKARKLRDYWVGSLLLSWLSFSGMRAVIEILGADHVLYPSLIDQPLVDTYFKDRVGKWRHIWYDLQPPLAKKRDNSIASFPNKFVCIVPAGKEEEIAAEIKASINDAWKELADAVSTLVWKHTGKNDDYLKESLERQTAHFWEHQWAATPLVSLSEENLLSELLGKKIIKNSLNFANKQKDLVKNVYNSKEDGIGSLYDLSHRLSQSALASIKTSKLDQRKPEPGIKCDLCGEFEIITIEPGKNPSSEDDLFWKMLRHSKENPREEFQFDFKKTERLCYICLIKRLTPAAIKALNFDNYSRTHLPLLKMVFENKNSFPSSTEIALSDFLKKAENFGLFKDKKERRKLIQFVHSEDASHGDQEAIEYVDEKEKQGFLHQLKKLAKEKNVKRTDADNYYAILMMDGDKMGKLVNGETISSRWKDVLHPDLVEKMEQEGTFSQYRDYWQKKDKLNNQRLIDQKRRLSPALHAAISESLGDFSIYGVPQVIKKYDGRLIYAGGDDICAVMPVSTVLQATEELSVLYRASFVLYSKDGYQILDDVEELGTDGLKDTKLSVHLGKGEKLSISAGILVCHHKKPLTGAIQRAHELLNKYAKTKKGRNAITIELDKRSGGGRLFSSRWTDDPNEPEKKSTIQDFLAVGKALGKDSRDMSSSLVYRLEAFRTGLEPLSKPEYEQQMAQFILKQLDRTELLEKLKEEEQLKLAGSITNILRDRLDNQNIPDEDKNKKDIKLSIEALIVAKFIGERINNREKTFDLKNEEEK